MRAPSTRFDAPRSFKRAKMAGFSHVTLGAAACGALALSLTALLPAPAAAQGRGEQPLGPTAVSCRQRRQIRLHPADHVAIMAECALRTIAIEFASANEDRIVSLEEAVVALRECCAAMEALEGA